MTPLVWKNDPSLEECIFAFSDKACVGFVTKDTRNISFIWELSGLFENKAIPIDGVCKSLEEGQEIVQRHWNTWCEHAGLEAKAPSFVTKELTLVQLLHHASSENYKSIADDLEKIRKRITKDDTEEWNALNTSIFYFRVEANKRSKQFKEGSHD